MGFVEALLLVSINFSDGMRSISEADILQELNNQTIVERPVYQEPINSTSVSEQNVYRTNRLELPHYQNSAKPVFTKGEGTEFSISWEHTIYVIDSDREDELLKPFYEQLSEKLGYTIERRNSFKNFWGSAGYGWSNMHKTQLYRDARVAGCFVHECIEDGQLRSISGNFDTKIDEVPYLEPRVSAEDATMAVLYKYSINPEERGVDNHGLWIDRDYISPVNKNNKLYYLIEVYHADGNKWYKVDAQKPVVSEYTGDHSYIY